MFYLRLLFISFLVLFFSCSNRGKKNTKIDDLKRFSTMEKMYSPIDTSEIYIEKDLLLNNNSYSIDIVKYCVNDSEVINEKTGWLTDTSKNLLEISSNYIYEITVFKDKEVLFFKIIYKDQFRSFIDDEYYDRVMLKNIVYERSSDNSIFFNLKIGIPNSDKEYELGFTFNYLDDQSNQLKYWILKRIEP